MHATNASCELRQNSSGSWTLTLNGRLDADSTAVLWKDLHTQLRHGKVSALEVEASGVEYCDGAGASLLQFLSLGGVLAAEAKPTFHGLRPEFLKLIERLSAEDYRKHRPAVSRRAPVLEHVGRSAVALAQGTKAELSFIGEVTAGLGRNMTRAKAMRWGEIGRVFERAGVDALPIISLISLLVGLIIAFEAAAPFAMFGAQIFIANMLGIIMAREMSALMTAIILAGRSSSAFAAELGTMKVNEELNALTTMGLDPVRFLVVQRLVAGVLLAPLLTIYSICVSIMGGVLVMVAMGFPLITIYNQMAQSVHCADLLIGVSKGVVFGALIAGIGCLRGLQTKQGPSAVGESTTRAVVASILLVIVADAVIAVLLYFLRI